MARYWKESTISLEANKPYQIMFGKPINCLIVKNPSSTNLIRIGLYASTSMTNYESTATFDSYGFLVRPNPFNTAVLITDADIDGVKIYETMEENITLLLPNMGTPPSGAVTVQSTVGLKPSDININPSTKNIGVDATFPAGMAVTSTVGLKPSDLAIDANKKLHVVTEGGTIPGSVTLAAETMTQANTEYSKTIPAGCKKITAMVRSNDASFRLAFEPGKVATPTEPYFEIPEGGGYIAENINLATGGTIYIASSTAGKTIQFEFWT